MPIIRCARCWAASQSAARAVGRACATLIWYGFGAPKSTPTEIIGKLNGTTRAALADPNTKSRLVGLGVEPMSMTPAEFGKFMLDETEKWGKVIRAANIKPE
jgi:tripartite-type tricarboxylate transporter receptor subunit TctC